MPRESRQLRWQDMLAVERRFQREGEHADFIPCVRFGKSAEFAEKYFRQGLRISVSGRIQTGSYTNKDGMKVYTTEVVVEEQEFAQSRAEQGRENQGANGNSRRGWFPEYPGWNRGRITVPLKVRKGRNRIEKNHNSDCSLDILLCGILTGIGILLSSQKPEKHQKKRQKK